MSSILNLDPNLEYMEANKDIYKFSGNLKTTQGSEELEMKQFVPRGAVIRNSNLVIALVVYTGVLTKMV